MTKNGSGREVPLSQRAFDALMDWKSRADVDRSTVFPMTAGALEQAWRRLLIRSGIKALRFHDLRHEGVSRLFERGLNMIEVSSISGHKELRMLKRYTHLSADDLVARRRLCVALQCVDRRGVPCPQRPGYQWRQVGQLRHAQHGGRLPAQRQGAGRSVFPL